MIDNLSVMTHKHYPKSPHKRRQDKSHNMDGTFIIENGFSSFTALQAEMTAVQC